ncbi:MAG: hypothetical protein ABJN51_05270, partial [Sneathiella sp.]
SIGAIMSNQEETLLRELQQKTARIQDMADREAQRAVAGVSGADLWPAKKELIDQCDQILDRLEKLYA